MRYERDRISQLLSDVIDGTMVLEPELAHELEHDLRFQAELVQYRKLLRALQALRAEVVDPGLELLDEVLMAVDEAVERRIIREIVSGKRAAYLGGLAAATAAGLGGALVIARRRRVAAAA